MNNLKILNSFSFCDYNFIVIEQYGLWHVAKVSDDKDDYFKLDVVKSFCEAEQKAIEHLERIGVVKNTFLV